MAETSPSELPADFVFDQGFAAHTDEHHAIGRVFFWGIMRTNDRRGARTIGRRAMIPKPPKPPRPGPGPDDPDPPEPPDPWPCTMPVA